MSRASQPGNGDTVAADQRRDLIVREAALLFDQKGYHQTTMADVAAAAGVRKPTLYHYVSSKDEILNWIHETFIDLLIDRQRARAGAPLGPAQMLLEMMADILELMATHRGHVRVFFEHHRELAPDQRAAITVKRDAYFAMFEGAIIAGVESGELATEDTRLTALGAFGMCNWAYQWYDPTGRKRTREVAYHLWTVLIGGIRAPGAG